MIISLFRVPSSLKVRISGTVAVPCVYVFIFSALRVLRHSGAILGGLRYDPLPLFIVQPVTIYLAISLIRVLKRKIVCLQRRFRRRRKVEG